MVPRSPLVEDTLGRVNQFKIRVSLRSKLLAILIVLPLISLGLYLAMATDLFKTDKVAYVYDSSATVSRGLAAQVRMQSQTLYGSFRSVAEQFDFNQKTFNADGQSLFNHNPGFKALVLYRRDQSGQFTRQGQLLKEDQPSAALFAGNETVLKSLIDEAARTAAYVGEFEGGHQEVVGAFRLGEATDVNQAIMVGVYAAEDLLNAFQATGRYSSFVVTRRGQVAIGKMEVVPTDLDQLKKVIAGAAGGGGHRRGPTGRRARLLDLVRQRRFGRDAGGVSKVDKARALVAVQVLLMKSLLFFIALIATTLLVSVFVSNRLTATIRELFEATAKMAQGDFDVKVQPRSADEVGGLAASFNWMASEVSRLMKETAESARMEGELNTVRTVQETLFPPTHAQFGPLDIIGHFEPASECGGDWWNYSRIGSKVFLWVGDATGHGAPAALITAAARSAAAVIESMPDMTPARAMTVLNRAIQQTSKGSIMMTFFIASIDLEAQTFTYACASHDPPYFMRRKGEKLVKRDLIPLNEVNGPRLGDQIDFVYDQTTISFVPGDLLFFYTDGVLDIEDAAGKKWGERAFLKSLIDNANAGVDLDAKMMGLRQEIEDFRGGSALIDDVTMVMCSFDQRSA